MGLESAWGARDRATGRWTGPVCMGRGGTCLSARVFLIKKHCPRPDRRGARTRDPPHARTGGMRVSTLHPTSSPHTYERTSPPGRSTWHAYTFVGRAALAGCTRASNRCEVAGEVRPRLEGTTRASDDRPGGRLGTRVTRQRGSSGEVPRQRTPRDRAKLVLRVSNYQRCTAPSGGVRTLSVPE